MATTMSMEEKVASMTAMGPTSEALMTHPKGTKTVSMDAHDGLVPHPAIKGLRSKVIDGGVQMLMKEPFKAYMAWETGAAETHHTHGSAMEWFVVKGRFEYVIPSTGETGFLKDGNFWFVAADVPHAVTCLEEGEIYAQLAGPPTMTAWTGECVGAAGMN